MLTDVDNVKLLLWYQRGWEMSGVIDRWCSAVRDGGLGGAVWSTRRMSGRDEGSVSNEELDKTYGKLTEEEVQALFVRQMRSGSEAETSDEKWLWFVLRRNVLEMRTGSGRRGETRVEAKPKVEMVGMMRRVV
jgi:hypothetical protein